MKFVICQASQPVEATPPQPMSIEEMMYGNHDNAKTFGTDWPSVVMAIPLLPFIYFRLIVTGIIRLVVCH